MDMEEMQDHLRRQCPNPLATTVLTQERDGGRFSIVVSPCSWMYPNHGFQICVTMAGGGDVCVVDRNLRFEDAKQEDMLRLFETVKVMACSRCGGLAFDPRSVQTNRAGVCEKCFSSDLQSALDKEIKKEAERLKRLDDKRKSEGFTHRVDAWVHPAAGGDDYPVRRYFKAEPSAEDVQRELRGLKSCVLDDFTITALS